MLKVMYVNALMLKDTNSIAKEGLVRGLKSSGLDVELHSFDIFQGPRLYSPRLMGVFARENHVNAVILSGSEKNTTDVNDPWVSDYYAGLKDLLEIPEDLNDWMGPPQAAVLGICFGHQALACVLGGETCRFQLREGNEKILALPQAKKHPLFAPILSEQHEQGAHLSTLVSHADHVVRLPKQFHCLFSSDYCNVQGMAHDKWPIVSLQSHPEFTIDLKKCAHEKKHWKHVPDDAFLSHSGPKILSHFAKWAYKLSR